MADHELRANVRQGKNSCEKSEQPVNRRVLIAVIARTESGWQKPREHSIFRKFQVLPPKRHGSSNPLFSRNSCRARRTLNIAAPTRFKFRQFLGEWFAPLSAMARRHARWTGSTGSSRPIGPSSSGIGLHLRLHLAGLAVRGLCGAAHRWQAREQFDANRLR
jgi:hypothetical protein